ncbi:MAG: hypothetical protein ACRCR2_03670 [Fusobacteriaceae bacterium]
MKIEANCGKHEIKADIKTLRIYDDKGQLVFLIDEEGEVYWNGKHNNN